ncbi:MAG: glycosyltransferase [Pseudomonadota bacterium]
MGHTVSVIIPTLNELTLRRTLDAVMRQDRPADEIIIVGQDEHGITDGLSALRFIDTGSPVCAAAARNRAIQASIGSVVAFTDSDCIPARDWLSSHLRAHDRGALVVGGSVIPDGANYLAQADNVSMFHDFMQGQPAGERFLLPTLNLSVRREVVDKVGYLDESFPGAAGEDADWTLQMRLAGISLRFEPAAEVRHTPARTRWRELLRHWRQSGSAGIRVRHRYADLYSTPHLAQSASLLRLLSPLIAAWVTAAIYRKRMFWRYLPYLPLVYFTKVFYCIGAAESVASGFAFSERESPCAGRANEAGPRTDSQTGA